MCRSMNSPEIRSKTSLCRCFKRIRRSTSRPGYAPHVCFNPSDEWWESGIREGSARPQLDQDDGLYLRPLDSRFQPASRYKLPSLTPPKALAQVAGDWFSGRDQAWPAPENVRGSSAGPHEIHGAQYRCRIAFSPRSEMTNERKPSRPYRPPSRGVPQ